MLRGKCATRITGDREALRLTHNQRTETCKSKGNIVLN
jgi:hypothetical protein